LPHLERRLRSTIPSGGGLCQPFLMRLPLSTRQYDRFISWTLRTLTRFHRRINRISSGRIEAAISARLPLLWLTTPGRVTGEARSTPLLCADDGSGNLIVAGSAGGNSNTPHWALNARAASLNSQSDCWIEISGERKPIIVVEIIDKAARAAAYKKLVSNWRWFQNYAERASRTIPVFLLVSRDRTPPTH
jgi:deazaflavin-dependent oxidoreductase (nitroreductase family)